MGAVTSEAIARGSGWRRLRRTALLLTLSLAVLGGCFVSIEDGIGVLYGPFGRYPFGPVIKAGSAEQPRNGHAAIKARRDGAGGNMRLPTRVRAPFRVRVRLGDFSLKQKPWGDGYVGVTVQDALGFGTAAHSVEVRESGDDLLVDATSQPGNVALPQVRLVNTRFAEVEIDHVGTDVVFRVRRPGDELFTPMGVAATAYTGPFSVSMDAGDLARGAEVGLDDVLVLEAADPPDLSTAELRAANHVERALHQLLSALAAIDALEPDEIATRGALANAEDRFAQAAQELETSGASPKIRKALATAVTKTGKVRKRMDKGKPAYAVAAAVVNAIRATATALTRLPGS